MNEFTEESNQEFQLAASRQNPKFVAEPAATKESGKGSQATELHNEN
jgi:hypothetical protein